MFTAAYEGAEKEETRKAITFIRVFSIFMWNVFPFVHFCSLDGSLPLEVIEPLWAATDW